MDLYSQILASLHFANVGGMLIVSGLGLIAMAYLSYVMEQARRAALDDARSLREEYEYRVRKGQLPRHYNPRRSYSRGYSNQRRYRSYDSERSHYKKRDY